MNRLNWNLLVGVLGLSVLVCALGGIILTALGKAVPDSIIALGSTALGGLVTAFVKPPS